MEITDGAVHRRVANLFRSKRWHAALALGQRMALQVAAVKAWNPTSNSHVLIGLFNTFLQPALTARLVGWRNVRRGRVTLRLAEIAMEPA